MKIRNLIVLAPFIICLVVISPVIAQRDLTHRKKGNRKDVFGGARDFRDLKNYGLQISTGFTTQFTGSRNQFVYVPDIRPYSYTLNPNGKIGGFFDIGTAHFPTSAPRLKFMKSRFISYYDWGVGFKLLAGKEVVDISYLDSLNHVSSTAHGEGTFYNGYAFGRATIHKNVYLGETYFLDNGLGINIDYRFLNGNKTYLYGVQSPAEKTFHKPFVAQIHYDLGVGIRRKRGSYIIPGIQIPIVGIVGHLPMYWFSSSYWPILIKVKYIGLFEKKKSKTSCNEGSEEDRKRNKEYLQGQ